MKKNFMIEKTAEQLEDEKIRKEKAEAVKVPLPSINETYSKILSSRQGVSFTIENFLDAFYEPSKPRIK